MPRFHLTLTFVLTAGALCAAVPAAPSPAAAAAKAPAASDPEKLKYPLPVPPDENVSYGPHRMQVIYF